MCNVDSGSSPANWNWDCSLAGDRVCFWWHINNSGSDEGSTLSHCMHGTPTFWSVSGYKYFIVLTRNIFVRPTIVAAGAEQQGHHLWLLEEAWEWAASVLVRACPGHHLTMAPSSLALPLLGLLLASSLLVSASCPHDSFLQLHVCDHCRDWTQVQFVYKSITYREHKYDSQTFIYYLHWSNFVKIRKF